MGNAQVNDCSGPKISSKEIKDLTYIGFTVEELKQMQSNDNNIYIKKQNTIKSHTNNEKK